MYKVSRGKHGSNKYNRLQVHYIILRFSFPRYSKAVHYYLPPKNNIRKSILIDFNSFQESPKVLSIVLISSLYLLGRWSNKREQRVNELPDFYR